MKRLVSSELRVGLRQFLSLIHPDKFSNHEHLAKCNSETFKVVNSIVNEFCDKLDNEGGGGDEQPSSSSSSFPIIMNNVEFFLPSNLNTNNNGDNSLKHVIPFKVKNDLVNLPRLSWQEAALSIFWLFTKAKLDYDQRISQWLTEWVVNFNHNEGTSEKEGCKIFELLYEKDHLQSTFSLTAAIPMVKRLSNVQISTSLCNSKKRLALQSMWYSRDVLYKLQHSKKGLKIIIGDHFSPHHNTQLVTTTTNSGTSNRIILLSPVFSPWDLLQKIQ